MPTPIAPREWVVLARVRRPWGRRGDLLVQLHTDWPDLRFPPGRHLLFRWEDGREREAEVAGFRVMGTGPMLALKGVEGIGEAREFAGSWIVARRADLQRPESEEWWSADLPGLVAQDAAGRQIGIVEELIEGPGGDWVRISRAGAAETLVPLAFCRGLERAAGKLVIDPPAGLLDEENAVFGDERNRR